MHDSTLQRLPRELLNTICQYLVQQDLVALAEASSFCKQLAYPHICQTIRIEVSSRAQLKLEADCWTSKISNSCHDGRTYRLEVDGQMAPESESTVQFTPSSVKFLRPVESYHTSPFPSERMRSRMIYGYKYMNNDHQNPQDFIDNDDDKWRPLATMISKLSALASLEYDCKNIFPPCLLAALQTYHPSCRLYIGTFAFRSLDHSATDLHPYEYALASSPCLYGITTRYSGNCARFSREACQWMVSKLAPNLKQVVLHRGYRLKGSSRLRTAHIEGAEGRLRTWPGFKLPESKTHELLCRGEVETLEIFNPGLGALISWSGSTNFAILQALRLNNPLNLSDLAWLHEEPTRFARLRTLCLNVTPPGRGSSVKLAEHSHLLCYFIEHLPPLRDLRLTGENNGESFRSIVACALEAHGASLDRLVLGSGLSEAANAWDRSVSLDVVKMIQEHCPRMEALNINVRRRYGDNVEASIYQALGKMPRLRYLRLTIDTTISMVTIERETTASGEISDQLSTAPFDECLSEPFPIPRPRSGGQPMPASSQVRKGHLRDTIVNSAFDEDLARGIFKLITSSKPSGSLPFEQLVVKTIGGDGFITARGLMNANSDGLDCLLKHIRGDWKLTRNPRDDKRDEISAMRINNDGAREVAIDESLQPIMRSIWPDIPEDMNGWSKLWHSFPLPGI